MTAEPRTHDRSPNILSTTQSPWRAIATAPKDGTVVMLHCRGFVPACCKWQNGHWHVMWASFDQLDSGMPSKWNPTHWMLLPAPPTEEAG